MSLFSENDVAVITGAADGIGRAAAEYFSKSGMQVCIADKNLAELEQVSDEIGAAFTQQLEVTDLCAIKQFKESVYTRFGRVDLLMNNAGIARKSRCSATESWRETIDVNFWGIVNGTQVFVEEMLNQRTPARIVNTGSKQGVTSPPGNPAYNVSKAAVRAFSENLEHEIRNTDGARLKTHLLVPGFTYTGMVKKYVKEKPPGAWWPMQVVEYMVEKMAMDEFYIICPDNEVDEVTDRKRIAWSAEDIVKGRPPMSRWHTDYKDAFDRFMNA